MKLRIKITALSLLAASSILFASQPSDQPLVSEPAQPNTAVFDRASYNKTLNDILTLHSALTTRMIKLMDQPMTPACKAELVAAANKDHEIQLILLNTFNKGKELHLFSEPEALRYGQVVNENLVLAEKNIVKCNSLKEIAPWNCTIL